MMCRFQKLLVLFIGIICSLPCNAQGFKVKELKLNVSDGSAFHAPLDSKGHPCGLIKVRSDNPDLRFSGEIVGDVENKMNEYWVFLEKDSKDLTIKHPHFLPLKVDFSAFGIEGISSKATYVMSLQMAKYKEKNSLTVTVNPANAKLFIDDTYIDNDKEEGLYQLYLPKGQYACRLEAEGFRPSVQIVTIGKEPQSVNVSMESILADVDITCETSTADIFINGDKKGIGGWKGKIIPGRYTIEVKNDGFESYQQVINVQEKENKIIRVPSLKRIVGTISIKTIPDGCTVMIDGQNYGKSPCTISDVVFGRHRLVVSLDSIGMKRTKEIDVDIIKKEIIPISCELTTKEKWDYYQKAYKWYMDADYYPGSIPGSEEGILFDKIMGIIDYLDSDFFLQEIREEHMGGVSYWILGEVMISGYSIAENNFSKQVQLAEKMQRKSAGANIEIGGIYESKGNYRKAIEWYNAALKVLENQLEEERDEEEKEFIQMRINNTKESIEALKMNK